MSCVVNGLCSGGWASVREENPKIFSIYIGFQFLDVKRHLALNGFVKPLRKPQRLSIKWEDHCSFHNGSRSGLTIPFNIRCLFATRSCKPIYIEKILGFCSLSHSRSPSGPVTVLNTTHHTVLSFIFTHRRFEDKEDFNIEDLKNL